MGQFKRPGLYKIRHAATSKRTTTKQNKTRPPYIE
jgi:hypothetical protein